MKADRKGAQFLGLGKCAHGAGIWISLGACALIGLIQSCGGDSSVPPTDPPPGDGTSGSYATPQSSDLIKDTRVRESSPSQTQGSLITLSIGDDAGSALDLLVMDSSVVFLDSIPPGLQITACTLWIKLNRMPRTDGAIVALDLWSVPEMWNENEVSWSNRKSALPWQTPGGGGAVVETALVSLTRLNLFDFIWSVRGAAYDTIRLESGTFIPIPIPDSLANANYSGQSFGIALRVNPATTSRAIVGVVSSEASAEQNRPFISWTYR
ncbi:MAG: DNRLRE domain-containing protein [Candidatus Zixiibacteriota bacterium]